MVLKSSKTTVGISAHALDVDVTASGESLQHAIDAVAEACVAKYKLLGRKLPTKAPEKFWNERDQIKRLVSFVEFGRKIIAGSDAKQTGVDGLQFQAALVTLMISWDRTGSQDRLLENLVVDRSNLAASEARRDSRCVQCSAA